MLKFRISGDELFHTDGQTDKQTDMIKLILAFRSFANAPNRRLGSSNWNNRNKCTFGDKYQIYQRRKEWNEHDTKGKTDTAQSEQPIEGISKT
jgi:hypothetical protein